MAQSTSEGFVPTPPELVDHIISLALEGVSLGPENTVLVPGCGEGSFIEGLLRAFPDPEMRPTITGVELNPVRAAECRRKYSGVAEIVETDFLRSGITGYDLIVGNPPYVAIHNISTFDRDFFKQNFTSAVERFDLYFLFFEHSLRKLTPNGRLAFVTPSKYLSVASAKGLRRVMAGHQITTIEIVSEKAFPGVLAYPCITLIQKPCSGSKTLVRRGCGTELRLDLAEDAVNWHAVLEDPIVLEHDFLELKEICSHIGVGPATGCDGLFVQPATTVFPPAVSDFVYPTIAGKQLVPGQNSFRSTDVMFVPYDRETSKLAAESGVQITDALLAIDPERTKQRKHVANERNGTMDRWFKFKDSIDLDRLLSPKILAKDITERPEFWMDSTGEIIPRHTVYYIIPKPDYNLQGVLDFLRSGFARAWLEANSPKASGGSLRVQAAVLKRMPVPLEWVGRIKSGKNGAPSGEFRVFSDAMRNRRHVRGRQEDVPQLQQWLDEAIQTRAEIIANLDNHDSQEGQRGIHIGGRLLDPLSEVAYRVAMHAGVPEQDIQIRQPIPTLGAFYTPTKSWDFAVVRNGRLLCVGELKSINTSFGNNMTNRMEEATGQGTNLMRALESNSMHPDSVWNGYVIIAPGDDGVTTRGTRTKSITVDEPGVDPEFEGRPYSERVVIAVRRMEADRVWTKAGCGLYDNNAGVLETIDYDGEPADDASVVDFFLSMHKFLVQQYRDSDDIFF